MSATLAGARVLVTGGATGVGRGIALACARAGADVVVHYRGDDDARDRAAAVAVVDAIRALGRRAALAPGDFRDETAVDAVADAAERALGGVDVLVNNAGITATAPLAGLTRARWRTLVDVNVGAALFLTQRLAPAMAARGGGVVVNLASLHAFLGRRDHAAYAATKGAIVALTRELAVELAPDRIRVVGVAPGSCVAPDDPVRGGDWLEGEGRALPAGRIAHPEELGRLVVFLAGPDGVHLVGQTLRYDGGWSALFPNVPDFRAPAVAAWGERYVADG